MALNRRAGCAKKGFALKVPKTTNLRLRANVNSFSWRCATPPKTSKFPLWVLPKKNGVLRSKIIRNGRNPRGFDWRALDLVFRGGMSKTGSSRSGGARGRPTPHGVRGKGRSGGGLRRGGRPAARGGGRRTGVSCGSKSIQRGLKFSIKRGEIATKNFDMRHRRTNARAPKVQSRDRQSAVGCSRRASCSPRADQEKLPRH